MGTVLEFKPLATDRPRERHERVGGGEVVIFPGVRIERHDLDLGYRVRNAVDSGEFASLGTKPRPRKTS